MKTKINYKKSLLNLLIVVFLLSTNFELIAQEKKTTDLKGFKIVIEKTVDGIKMKSIEGSAWGELSFSLNDFQPQSIDEYGMTDLNKVSENKNAKLANYLFTITKIENRIELKGIKGTAWSNLSFTLVENKKQAIDQYGMTKLN